MTRSLTNFGEIENSVAAKYGKALVHLRHQRSLERFGLVLGAGFSKPLRFPTWAELLARIATNERVAGAEFIKKARNYTSLSQLLYERFRGKPDALRVDRYKEEQIRRQWIELIRRCLYRDAPRPAKELIEEHPYLWTLMPLVKEAQLTVNYNFDDTIERALEAGRDATEKNISRGFTTIWDSNVLNVPRTAVIYHPNGFLPISRFDKGSDDVVFLEDSFADQLLESMAGHYTSLTAHYEQNTCLFVGLSLEDQTLRHLLRKNAHVRPGHFHYFVQFIRDERALTPEYKNAVISANFRTYNLVTLFLTNREIAAFAKLLQADPADFSSILHQEGHRDSLIYYITGCVSVGKTTLIDHLRSFIGHGEWTEKVLPTMRQDPKKLSPGEELKVNTWVANQYRKKNDRLHGLGPGIYVIDRAFLDAFAFSPRSKWRARAKFNRRHLNPKKAKSAHGLRSGHVILLLGDPHEMSRRALAQGKKFNAAAEKSQQDKLKDVYLKLVKGGVTKLTVNGLEAVDVAKEAARIILLNEYKEADLDRCLRKLEGR